MLISSSVSQGWLAKLIEALPPEIVGAFLTGGAVLAFQMVRERISHARYREKMALTHHSRLAGLIDIYETLHKSGSLDRHLNDLHSGDIARLHQFMGSLTRTRLDLRDMRQFLISVRDSHELDSLVEVMQLLDKIEGILISDEAVVKSRIDGQLSIVLRQIAVSESMDVKWLNTAFIEGLTPDRITDALYVKNLISKLSRDIAILEGLKPDTITAFLTKRKLESNFSIIELSPEGRTKRRLLELRQNFLEKHPLNGLLRLCLTPLERALLRLEPFKRKDDENKVSDGGSAA